MHIDATIIVIVIVSVLGIIGLVAIFAVVFLRKLGTKKDYKKQEREDLEETKTYSPVPFDDTPMEYTTTNVQPESKGDTLGYPHNMQVKCFGKMLYFFLVHPTTAVNLYAFP